MLVTSECHPPAQISLHAIPSLVYPDQVTNQTNIKKNRPYLDLNIVHEAVLLGQSVPELRVGMGNNHYDGRAEQGF